MKKGFLATAILLISITIVHQAAITQNIIRQKTLETKNTIRLHRKTQETRYQLTQGFKSSIKESLKKTQGEKPIIREQKACKEVKEWFNEVKESKKEKNIQIELKAGYIDKKTYEYNKELEYIGKSFKIIQSKLKKNPKEVLEEIDAEATLCTNYLSIKEEKPEAKVKDNNYLRREITGVIDKEPVYLFKLKKGNLKQKVVIPGGTKINVEA